MDGLIGRHRSLVVGKEAAGGILSRVIRRHRFPSLTIDRQIVIRRLSLAAPFPCHSPQGLFDH